MKDFFNNIKNNLLKEEKIVSIEFLSNVRKIYLLFMGSWCPNCNIIMPYLKEYYKNKNKEKNVLEIILILAEDNLTEFNEFTEDLPFVIIRYNRDVITKLYAYYNVKEIPLLLKIDQYYKISKEYSSEQLYHKIGYNI